MAVLKCAGCARSGIRITPSLSTLAKGEVLGFAGLVGAGRSEVARAIFGVEEALETEVALNGQTLKIRDPQDAITHGIYLVPEDRRLTGLIVDFNVREKYLATKPREPIRRQRSSIVPKKRARLAKQSRQSISKRRHRRCALQISVAATSKRWCWRSGSRSRPRVLIFDEPTRGIDVGAKSEIYELIRKLAAKVCQ